MNKRKSFTLIEVIMAIVIVSIISIPASLVLSQYIRSFSLNQDLSCALQIARLDAERIYLTDFEDIDSLFITNYENTFYDLEREVIYKEGSPADSESLKQINVRVYAGGENKLLSELVIYRAKNVLF
jgi:prepilin-type N-terminal cleavage/methylation domain-containing protein